MAVVHIWSNESMLSAPHGGSDSDVIGDQEVTDLIGDASYMTLIGSFIEKNPNPTSLVGTVSQVIFGYGDSPVPSGEMTGLSHTLIHTDVDEFIDGNFASVQELFLGGDDTVFGGSGDNGLEGYAGNDVLVGGPGADALYGGIGTDTASYVTATAGVDVDLVNPGVNNHGDAQGDTYDSIENVTGSQFGDVLRGDGGGNAISGLGGNDYLSGAGAADRLDGGAGTDAADYYTSAAPVNVDLASSKGQKGGDAAGDTLVSIENLYGSDTGSDHLTGDKGANRLQGNGGDDVLTGGKGSDTLIGNAGADHFVFNSVADTPAGKSTDTITDFSHADGDQIDLSGIDANPDHKHDQDFTFIGDETFKHHHNHHPNDHSGLVRYDAGVISGETSGDKHADFQIAINTDVVKGDFLL